ncbi:MAG TPA: hypothetical protein VIZ28_10955 [Chitinophagaceae bacterium]
MRELFRKYLDNNCSPAEVRKLLAYFNIDENEVILRRLITEWLEKNAEEEDEDHQWQNNFYTALGLIRTQLSNKIIRLIAIFRKIGFQIIAELSSGHLPVAFPATQLHSIKNQ